MRKSTTTVLTLAAIIAVAGVAQASTRVVGNGLAGICSRLALSGEYDRQTLNTCTLALENEALGPENTAKTYVNRGVVQLRRAAFADARNDFGQAERLMPALPEIYVNRGVVLMKERRWKEAVSELDRGIALKPFEVEKAYFDRALAREQIDDFKGAYADFNKAAEINPTWEAPKKELLRYKVQRG